MQSLKIERFIGVYGSDRDRHGVLSDHIGNLEEAGGAVTRTGSGLAYFPDEMVMVPILCSDIIEVWTEDGRETGRCGERVAGHNIPWCRKHQLAEPEEMGATCQHGMAAWLCAGPAHYPMD